MGYSVIKTKSRHLRNVVNCFYNFSSVSPEQRGFPMKKQILPILALVLLLGMLSACGTKPGETVSETKTDTASAETETASETGAPAEIEPVTDAIPLTVLPSDTKQTIDGFGAGFTWYSAYAFKAAYSDEILAALFDDAKLSILRFKNEYGYDSFESSAETNLQFYTYAENAAQSRGEDVKILYTSWSPIASLKSNDSINGGGSLKKDEDGNYVYDEFADWWTESVKAYREKGIPVDYVSIQNECDFEASYDGCEFKAVETDSYASYAKAFLATYSAFTEAFGDNVPKMIAPETMSVDPGTLKSYLQEIVDTDEDSVYAVGHHLYLGGTSSDDPNNCDYDSFLLNFMDDAAYCAEHNYKAWQTEFYRGTSLQTANIISNSLVYENASAYIYWGGIWNADSDDDIYSNDLIPVGIALQDWPGPHGYVLTGDYYALRHFSEYIRPDYVRVETQHDAGLKTRTSAFLSPDKSRMVLVLINNSDEEETMQLLDIGFTVTDSLAIQSIFKDDYTAEDLYQSLGSLDANLTVTLPATSVTTVVLDGNVQ